MNSLRHSNFVRKCIPMPQAMKIPDANAAVENSEKNLRRKTWNLTKAKHKTKVIVAKSKPTAMNLTSTVSTSSSSVNHPIASKSHGTPKASTGKPNARARRNSKPDAVSSSQGRLKDAYLGGLMVEVAGKLAATDRSQESWEFF